MIEEYKKITNYSHYRIYSDGRIYSEFVNRFITPTQDSNGYLQNTIVDDFGNRKTIKTHRLVAMAFLPNPNKYSDVNHKDFNRKNNDVKNLEWCTSSYNKTYGTGRIKRSLRMKEVWASRRADNGKNEN